MTVKTLFALIAVVGIGCSSSPLPTKQLPLTTPETTFTCATHEWHEEWSEADACVTCAQDVQTCVRGKGDEFCREACDVCLGEDICAIPSNIDFAVASNEAAQKRPGQIRALIRADLNQTPVSWTQAGSDGLVLIKDTLFDKNGRIWTLALPEGCQRPQLNEGIVYSLCKDQIEVFSAKTGFKLSNLPVVFEFDSYTDAQVDPFGKSYVLTNNVSARIFDAAGKQLAMYEYPDGLVRVGPTWAEHAVLQGQQIRYFSGGERTHTEPSRFPKDVNISVHGSFISSNDGLETHVFDARSRTWFSSPGYLDFQGPNVLQFDADKNSLRRIYPTEMQWNITQKIPALVDSHRRWLSNPDFGTYRVINDELFATVFTTTMLVGAQSAVIPALHSDGNNYKTTATRHGGIIWASAIENEDAVWIASPDGLVKRWSFETGQGVRADIPFEFAIGGGHATPDGGLVLMSRTWNSADDQYSPDQRVMIWHPDREARFINVPNHEVLDIALIDDNTLVVVGQDSTIWWDIKSEKVTHTEPGMGQLSENGKSIAFFVPWSVFDRVDGPARFFRTDNVKKQTKLNAVQSCAFSPNGEKIVCTITKGGPNQFYRRVFNVADGKMTDEKEMNGSWIVGQLSPDGDSDLQGDRFFYRNFSTGTGGSYSVSSDSAYVLGFTYSGRLMKVEGDYLSVEDY